MRRPRFALTSAIAAVGLSAGIAVAQQPPSPGNSSSTPVVNSDPMLASKAARYLLRNGMDYLAYREYDRALSFLRAAEARQNELNDAERVQLKKGIAKVQDAKREAVNGARVAVVKNGRATAVQPGAIALARPAKVDNVQLTAATLPELPASAPEPAPRQAPAMAEPGVAVAGIPAVVAPTEAPTPASPAVAPASEGLELPSFPTPPQPLPDLATPVPVPSQDPAPPAALPAVDPVPATPAQAAPPVEALPGADLPTLPSVPIPTPAPASPPMPESVPAADPSAVPARAGAPMLPEPVAAPLPEPTPAPAPVAAPLPEPMPYRGPAQSPAAESVPAPEASAVPMPSPPIPSPAASNLGNEELHRGSLLSPRLREEIERIAQRPTGADSVTGESADPNASAAPSQGSTRLELTRAPSPTEARPLRKIPVPEEFVPLPPRKWDPARKYWSAAGTCHMPLYFQDPVLERYGQSAEQALGPIGRYFSYPLDDPRQSNQRNQILQPFYSMGKFAFQVGTLPYKMLVDPPWEAEYDLGYYRPGDKIPADTIMITPYGVGPPLKGRNY